MRIFQHNISMVDSKLFGAVVPTIPGYSLTTQARLADAYTTRTKDHWGRQSLVTHTMMGCAENVYE